MSKGNTRFFTLFLAQVGHAAINSPHSRMIAFFFGWMSSSEHIPFRFPVTNGQDSSFSFDHVVSFAFITNRNIITQSCNRAQEQLIILRVPRYVQSVFTVLANKSRTRSVQHVPDDGRSFGGCQTMMPSGKPPWDTSIGSFWTYPVGGCQMASWFGAAGHRYQIVVEWMDPVGGSWRRRQE